MTPAHPTAADALAAALAEPQPAARGAHLTPFADRADELRAALRTAFADPRAETRRRAVALSAEVRPADAELRDALTAALADAVWSVREAATGAYARFRDGESHARLVALTLSDPSPLVRRAAAAAVGLQIQPTRDYGTAVGHRFERQRIRAADALGFVGSAAGTAPAVALLTDMVTDPHPKVRAAALRALARLDIVAVRPLLPLIERKCTEAEPRVAGAARELRARLERVS